MMSSLNTFGLPLAHTQTNFDAYMQQKTFENIVMHWKIDLPYFYIESVKVHYCDRLLSGAPLVSCICQQLLCSQIVNLDETSQKASSK